MNVLLRERDIGFMLHETGTGYLVTTSYDLPSNAAAFQINDLPRQVRKSRRLLPAPLDLMDMALSIHKWGDHSWLVLKL